MKPEKEFDKILQQRIEESEGEFAFDESNWQKASALIDAERGVAGYGHSNRYLLAGALLLVLGSLGFFTYTFLNSGNSKQVSGIKASAVLNEKQHKTEFVRTGTENEKITAGNSSAHGKSSVILNENKVSNEKVHVGAIEASNDNTRTSSVASPLTLNKRVVNKTVVRKSVSSSGSNAFQGTSVHHAQTGSSDNKNETMTSAGNEATVIPSENEFAGANMYENLFLNTRLSKLPAHTMEEDIRKTPYDFIRIYRDDYFTSRKRKTFYLDVEAGAAYMTGWNTAKGKDAKGFNAYAGLNVGFHIKKKFSASVGAQIYNISNIQQPFYSASSVSYDFGSNGTYTTIATNSLLYAAIPVKINYAINKRNVISVGVNAGILFNGRNTIETFVISDGVKSNVHTTQNTGYYEGTNQFNMMITAGYSRAVTRRIKVNGEVMYGLSDIYKNTGNLTKENNSGVRLGLQYTLFAK